MRTSHNPLTGDIHGFLVYPISWAKPADQSHLTVRELTALRRQQHAEHRRAADMEGLQFALPRKLGSTIFASPNEDADPLSVDDAAHRLFRRDQQIFSIFAEEATRRRLGITHFDPQDHFSHLHGIGSWENNPEPSMVTVFHKPISDVQLQQIAAEMGVWAKQHGILAFAPHPAGTEQMLHMRLQTHEPRRQMGPHKIAQIVKPIIDDFNQYADQGDRKLHYWMPGRSILPHPDGTTDVLVWVPPWESHPERVKQAFSAIAEKHKAIEPVKYWPGTGIMLGGTSPYSDDEAEYLSDKKKRELAIENYKLREASPQHLTYPPSFAESQQFARSPAGTGAVVRGVYYEPGKMMPDVEPAPQKKPNQRLQAMLKRLQRKKV